MTIPKLIVDGEGECTITSPDPALIKAVAKAHTWNRTLIVGEARSVRALARDIGVTNRYVRKLLPLAFLAPDIIDAILGRTVLRRRSTFGSLHAPIQLT